MHDDIPRPLPRPGPLALLAGSRARGQPPCPPRPSFPATEGCKITNPARCLNTSAQPHERLLLAAGEPAQRLGIMFCPQDSPAALPMLQPSPIRHAFFPRQWTRSAKPFQMAHPNNWKARPATIWQNALYAPNRFLLFMESKPAGCRTLLPRGLVDSLRRAAHNIRGARGPTTSRKVREHLNHAKFAARTTGKERARCWNTQPIETQGMCCGHRHRQPAAVCHAQFHVWLHGFRRRCRLGRRVEPRRSAKALRCLHGHCMRCQILAPDVCGALAC